jgi:FlaA1/EpsC-like NDP-sugar epimerase
LAIAGHDTVIHTAAYKYVPQAEKNVIECHEINVMGSLNVARASIRCGVERVIGVSTDKACDAQSVYGSSKWWMERIFQGYTEKTATQFNLVRYGNVASSTGSVIPLFRQQLKDTGMINVTNPDMTRFWLSVESAVGLINVALHEKEPGTIIIPRLPAMALKDLALIALNWREAATIEAYKWPDPRINITGPRAGENIHEKLLSEAESRYAIREGAIMRLYPTFQSLPSLELAINEAYSSDKPDHWLTHKEMLDLIGAA